MKHLSETINQQVQAEEALVLERLAEPAIEPDFRESPGVQIPQEIVREVESIASREYGTDATGSLEAGNPPGHVEDADVAIAMFPLAKVARTSPARISQTVAAQFPLDGTLPVESAVATGPYLNVRYQRGGVYDDVLADVLGRGPAYGHVATQAGKVIQIDYSSPNIAKKLGLQHAPTTIVGEALARINEAAGAHVIRTNHLGDFGTPFGKVLVGLDRYVDHAKLADDPVAHMHELYVRVNNEAKTDESMNVAARQAFAALEQGDPQTVARWESLRAANIAENQVLYDRLGVHFDTVVGESYFSDSAQEIIDELVAAGIAREEAGAVVVLPENAAGNPLLLRKSDGSTLYGARDLAALRYRMNRYQPDEIKYVVGAEQAEQLESVFTVAALARIIPERATASHVKLGLLADKSGKKLSSRSGMTDTLESVLDTAATSAADSLRERYAGQPERLARVPELAEMLGTGAVAYSVLRSEPGSNTVISEGTGATRDAGTAGYLQYTHARAGSVVRKAEINDEELAASGYSYARPEEWAVAKAVMDYPMSVARAAETNGPHHVARALETVAARFSTMYQSREIPIVSADGELRRSRVALTRAVQHVLHNGLDLLGIKAPDHI